MLKNYFKIALRNIRRQKGYSFINIFGLAAGVASCLLIMLWVQNELDYDKFNQKAERIYRLYGDLTFVGNKRSFPVVGAPVGPALKETFPEVENFVRMSKRKDITVKSGNNELKEENVFFAENSIFEVFSFPLIKGSPATALTTKYSIVLAERTAKKYFGSENPLGKTLKFSDGHTYSITGVMKDIPSNSHFEADIFCSYETWIDFYPDLVKSWGDMDQTTYILTRPGVDYKALEKKFEPYIYDVFGSKIKKVGAEFRLGVQPLGDIHLYSDFENDDAKTGNIMYVYLFSGIAIFILLIACINFVNLSTARYSNRALEVGLRKTLGASRSSLVKQFLGETILLTFISVMSGLLIALLLLPFLESIAGQTINYFSIMQPLYFIGLIISIPVIGILAGIYPAIFLSSFMPIKTLKGHLKRGASSSVFRRVLVIVQFSISIALIIWTINIYQQLQFIRNKNLGFNKNQILTLPYPNNTEMNSLRQELLSVPGVINAGVSSEVPGVGIDMRNFRPEGWAADEGVLMQQLNIEPNFLTTLDIEIIKGRNFSNEFQTDRSEAIIINETVAKQLGWKDPIGKSLYISGRGSDGKPADFQKIVIGVVKDFHTASLHNKIDPLVIFNNQYGARVISLKLTAGRISETVTALRNKWESMFPDRPFNYSFLDETFDNQYRSEERMNKIFTSFSFIAIMISCLGLFGLASYMTEKRTKEVGIRKVLGATVPGILFLLSKEFTIWVLVANIISWPAAYYLMNNWLQTFAYHVDLTVWIFLFSGLIALLIAWLTVSYQSIKIARTNPANSIRYE